MEYNYLTILLLVVLLILLYIFYQIYRFYNPYFPYDEKLDNCKWTRWGCCNDKITPKYDIDGSNCKRFEHGRYSI